MSETTKDLRPLLRRLANLLDATSLCIRELVDSYSDSDPEQPAASRSSSTSPTTSQPTWSWAALVELSIQLVTDTPDHTWSWDEFVALLRARGVTLGEWRGVNARLVAELKTRGVVAVEGKGKRFRCRQTRLLDAAEPPAKPKTARRKTRPQRTSVTKKRERAPKPGSLIPWDELVRISREILEGQTGHRWSGMQLCQPLRDRGVTMPTWKGVPFGLVGRLHTQRVVQRAKDNSFLVLDRRSVEPPPTPVPATSPEPAERRPHVVDPDENDDVYGLVEEIETVSSYVTDLPHRQVTSQICLWAGRARQIQETLGNRPPPVARALKDALNMIFRRLLELTRRHSPGWIDAPLPQGA